MRSADPIRSAQLRLKRAFDIITSALLLVMLAPMLGLAALAIRLTSAGPVLYSGRRWGRDESTFACLKFRSMYVDQARILTQRGLIENTGTGTLLKLADDPRVTPVGALLRSTSVDELPQLINVLRGDMSLVGPRPLVLHMLEPHPDMRRERSVVRPGITGLWQIRHRDKNTSVLDMIDDDLEYITTFSLWLDLKILALTIPALLSKRGAH